MNAWNTPGDGPFGGPGFGGRGGRGPGGRGGFGGRGRGRPPLERMAEKLEQVAEAAQAAGEAMDDDERGGRGFGPRGRGGPHGRGGPRGRGRGFGPRGGPGGGPGGFGPGFPPGPPPGFGRRGGRRTNRGDVRTAVLAVVAENPRHGYEIISEITHRTNGQWKPSPGSVYPTLSQLEDEGLVRVEQTDGRRVVHLTEEGTRYVSEHQAEIDAVWSGFDESGDDEPATKLWQELGQLHGAAQQVMAAGSPEQIATATESLAEARKAIYRLLAE